MLKREAAATAGVAALMMCFGWLAAGCQPEDGFDEGGEPATLGDERAGESIQPPPPQRGGPADGEAGDSPER